MGYAKVYHSKALHGGNESRRHVIDAYVMVQFYHWFKIYFSLFLVMVMYDKEFKTKESNICTKDKIEPQHIQQGCFGITVPDHIF